jgi:hypothetical protein
VAAAVPSGAPAAASAPVLDDGDGRGTGVSPGRGWYFQYFSNTSPQRSQMRLPADWVAPHLGQSIMTVPDLHGAVPPPGTT